jgi:hypothetical protein
MIRPVTLICMLGAAGSGLYLYQEKQQARQLDRHIAEVRAEIQTTRNRSGVLRAEYTLLNDPDRLASLATQYVPDLKPTQPPQWTSLAELDKRLPPVGAPTAAPAPLEPDAPDVPPPASAVPSVAAPSAVENTPVAAAPVAPAAEPAPVALATPATPAPQAANDAPKLAEAAPGNPPDNPPAKPAAAVARPAPRPVQLAAAHPLQHQPVRVAAHPASRPPSAPVVTASVLAPLPRVSARVTAPPPAWHAAPPVPVAASYAAATPPAPHFVGSALGMARMGASPTSPAAYPIATAPLASVSTETLR